MRLVISMALLALLVSGCVEVPHLEGSYRGTVAPTTLCNLQGRPYPALLFILAPRERPSDLPLLPLTPPILVDEENRLLLLPAISPGDMVCITGRSGPGSARDLSGETMLMWPPPSSQTYTQYLFYVKRIRLLHKAGARPTTSPTLHERN